MQKERLKERLAFRKWCAEHPGYMKEYCQKWREQHPDYHKQRYLRTRGSKNQVYLIRNLDTGRLKIGKGNGLNRLDSLQKSTDCELQLLHHWEVVEPFAVETALKSEIEQFWHRGEWYVPTAYETILEVMKRLASA